MKIQIITEGFMDKQPMRWVTRMYTFLRTAAPKLWKITSKEKDKTRNNLPFRKAPIIKTQRGEWVAPFIDVISPNVYLPIKNQDRNESDYNFISSEYLENEMARKFFTELELKEPNQDDYIRQVILGKYKGEDIDIDNDVLRTDFEILLEHYIEEKNKRLVANDYIQLLISQYWIAGKDKKLHRPQDLYFENILLELYFSDKSNI